MGIPGIIKEIGPGDRVAISKLAVEHLEKSGRPFRVAIDISIWQFQVQTGRGGTNPALRTLYYRLLRLLSLCIQPLFIFDGPNRPLVKRGRQTGGGNISSMPNYMAKNLLDLFGFPYISAPGEAEAECALLQREGIVDAVLSDDVDTLMFGSTLTLRNWSAETTRGNKNPTHVNAYHSKATKESSGLDRAGMILVALMSGGDYAPGGIPSCGPKIACEAAKAGFGEDLCKISRKDQSSFNQWRERLQFELHTNESGLFRTKHRTLNIPGHFPDKTILGYYTHPVISSAERVADLRTTIKWDSHVKIPELRAFCAEAFEWLGLPGAKKFIRVVAPTLLIQKLWRRSVSNEVDGDDMKFKEEQESHLIKSLHGKRSHSINDGAPEIRVSFLPSEIVGLDLNQEDTEAYLGMNMDDDSASEVPDIFEVDGDYPVSPSKRRSPSQFDPDKEQKIWIMETIAKLGVPLTVETWEENMRNPTKFAARKAPKSKSTGRSRKAATQTAALETYLKASKPVKSSPETASSTTAETQIKRPRSHQVNPECCPTPEDLSDGFNEVMDEWENMPRKLTGRKPLAKRQQGSSKNAPKPHRAAESSKHVNISSDPLLSNGTNPWTLSRPASDPSVAKSKIVKKPSASVRDSRPIEHESALEAEKACWDAEKLEILSLLTPTELAQMTARGLVPRNFKPTLDPSRAPYYERVLEDVRGDAKPAREIVGLGMSRSVALAKASSHREEHPSIDKEEATLLPSSQPLPPLSESAAPRGLSKAYSDSPSASRGNKSHLTKTKTAKQAITLRESLEGAWKAVDGLDLMVKDPKRMFHGIEVIDLLDD